MKKNNKGFMLLETLVVSTFILGTLIFLYIQFSSVKRTYDVSFRYNTVPGLYNAKTLSSYLSEYGYSSIDSKLSESTNGYVNITDCIYSGTLCNKIVRSIDAKTVLYVGNNISVLKNNLSTSNYDTNIFNEEFKKYILQLNTTEVNGKNRLIIEYNDNTFATVSIKDDLNTGTAYNITNLVKNSGFENNTTNWSSNGTFSASSTIKHSGNTSGKFTNADSSIKELNQEISLISGHKYYASEWGYLDQTMSTGETGEFDLYRVGGTIAGYPEYGNSPLKTLTLKTWTFNSFTFTSTVTNAYNFRAGYLFNPNTIYFDDTLLIDLTAAFGSGNEPSKEWCDANISYFEGTSVIYK